MGLRGWLLLALLVAIGWWHSPLSPRVRAPPAPAAGVAPGCPPPPRVARGGDPLQTPVPAGLAPFRLEAAELRPLAGFSIEARVLSREDYLAGREAALSPTDLALGWGPMRTEAVLDRLDIRQSNRWYHYRWRGEPPLPPRDIIRTSANMHMVPADATVAEALARIDPGDAVRIDGWLVEAVAPDGWRWRSSTRRDDTGDGACELVYVCGIAAE